MKRYNSVSSGAFIEEFIIQPYQKGLLTNLTFAVKDCIDVNGKITGFGNPCWLKTHPVAVTHAVCVELLLANGAICHGKTITDEFTYSLIGENHFYGTPINPTYPNHVPGGSSSGSASAVACGLVDFSLGTDTGGSIRVPAANCNIYGYRPTHGRISVAGVIPLAPTFDTVGILAKNISTLKFVASTLLGINLDVKVLKPKICVVQEVFEVADPNIRAAVLKYLDNHIGSYSFIKLADITLAEVTLKWLFELYVLIHSCEAWSVHGAWVESIKPNLGPTANFNFNNIAKVANRKLLSEYIEKRELFSTAIRYFLGNDTILCFPTVPEIAPKKGFHAKRPEVRTSGGYFQNLIGVNAIAVLSRSPQITIPIENSAIPASISFMTGQNQDEMLFSNFL